jgi:hypothetical protein
MDIKRIGSGDENDHCSIPLMNIYLISVLTNVVYMRTRDTNRKGERGGYRERYIYQYIHIVIDVSFHVLKERQRGRERKKEKERERERKTAEARQTRKTMCSCPIVNEMKVTKAVMQN